MFLNLTLIILLAVAVAAVFLVGRRERAQGRREAELEALADKKAQEATAASRAARIVELESDVRALRDRVESANRDLSELGSQRAALEASLREIRNREPEMKAALANFLQEKGEGLTKHNTEVLNGILDPLKERLKEFEKKVDDADKGSLTRHTELKVQLDLLSKMNDSLGVEARSLTAALKGENKAGGDWGELVLERVLESSGLEKDREYRIQPVYAGEDGPQRPDVVIDLPDSRHLVVDSKVSLIAYKRYCEAVDSEVADAEMGAHIQSVRQHVDQLSSKKYQDIHSLNSVDFVFLFMAVEPAFIEASKRDPSLFHTAFSKNIVIVSPSTLLATLRTVASIWKQEKQNRNVREIARQAGALHAKFAGLLTDLDKVGKALDGARDSFNEAKSKLAQGKGNLVSRVENLKRLGAKSDKTLPATWLAADDEEGEALANQPALPLEPSD